MANKNLKNLGLILSQGAMAMGEGMTGRPFLSNYQQMQMQRDKLAQEQKYKDNFNAFITGMNGTQTGEMPKISSNMKDNPQFIAVPNDKGSYDLQPNPLWKAEMEAGIRGKAKAGEAIKKATGNFGRVAAAVKQYADYYSQAIDEGGAGGMLAKQKGTLITRHLGGSLGENMIGTGKLFGQRAELSLSMVPILTNQNRFMTSIMDYINQSLPQGNEGAQLASGKLEQTLLNQYTTTKVLTRLGFDPDIPEEVEKINAMGDQEAAGLAQRVVSMAQVYKLTDKETEEFNEIKKDTLGSLSNKKPASKEIRSFKNEAEAEKAGLKSGTEIKINGRRAIWE